MFFASLWILLAILVTCGDHFQTLHSTIVHFAWFSNLFKVAFQIDNKSPVGQHNRTIFTIGFCTNRGNQMKRFVRIYE